MRSALLLVATLLVTTACYQEKESSSSSSSQLIPESKALKMGAFLPTPIGDPVEGRPWITDLTTTDLDNNGLMDILLCEGRFNEVRVILQTAPGIFAERQIGETIEGPVHVATADMDGDGDLDVLVASMGVVFPNPLEIGAVVILEQVGKLEFKNRIIASKVHRVTDVQAGDLDGDGDLDLSVAKFGYDQGETCWMENQGNWKFSTHTLHPFSGAIHA
ncbi:MAG: VCBS repeat-containing protein, partial [Verrucomicrobiae bacterium]|nr:VCBS repeat-containing protein [Verrucomicrobiae bacterium]